VPYHRRVYGLIPHIVIRFREAECTTAAASFQQFFGFLNLVQVLRNYGDDSKRRVGASLRPRSSPHPPFGHALPEGVGGLGVNQNFPRPLGVVFAGTLHSLLSFLSGGLHVPIYIGRA
jgi:hypothetical protein